MIPSLRCYSFHSVKGGVGKSTLSTVTALALAREYPEASVFLVDMDLTGTSLADVLPLEAPRWDGVARDVAIDLGSRPSGFHSRDESRARIELRQDTNADSASVIGVSFLNDYLLFVPPNWDEAQDVNPTSIAWRVAGGPSNLLVFPSSAVPRDLERALSVIYDEEHAAFLESRLEYLLSALLERGNETFVVFDTPPTIPGLSRSVLGLAFRLSRPTKTPLSEDGFIPHPLEETSVDWRAFMVATRDYQDIRAAKRWLDLVQQPDQDVIRLVVNRADGDVQQNVAILADALPDNANPLVSNPIWVKEDVDLRSIFHGENPPPTLRELLQKLDQEPG